MHPQRSIAEDELVGLCKTGSLKHQEMLYKRFYGYAMGVSLRYSLNREDALETVNDAFIKVFKAIKSYNSDKPFKAWLRTILVNTAIDRRRKDLKHLSRADIEDVDPAINADAIESLDVQDILKLMHCLPPLQLTIFNLYEIDGYSHDEISRILDIPESSSRVYLSRAKEKLRNAIRKEAIRHGRTFR